ncbi:hypothetical protein ACFQMM_21985 [Saliphagus sp. GCM10025308]
MSGSETLPEAPLECVPAVIYPNVDRLSTKVSVSVSPAGPALRSEQLIEASGRITVETWTKTPTTAT